MTIVGTLSFAVKDLDRKGKAKDPYFNKYAQKEWQWREQFGETSVLEKMQQLRKKKIDDSFIGTRIQYLSELDLVGEGNMKELCYISDDTWVNPGKLRQYYKEK